MARQSSVRRHGLLRAGVASGLSRLAGICVKAIRLVVVVRGKEIHGGEEKNSSKLNMEIKSGRHKSK